MRNLSRRELLKGIASTPFLGALSPLRAIPRDLGDGPQEGEVDCQNELRIVLHGAFAVILNDSQIQLYAPTVRDHAYKAGCWGQELRLEEGGRYSLTTGSELCPSKLPKIDASTNAVLYGKTPELSIQEICFCSFHGPLPNEIHSLRRVYKAKPSDNFFDESQGSNDAKNINANLKTFSLVHVLVYKFKTAPEFTDLPDIPWRQTYKEMFLENARDADSKAARSDLPRTFHFFAEPDTEVQQQRAFPEIVAHFSDVTLEVADIEPSHKIDWSTNLKGLHRWEQRTLLERSKLRHHSDCRSMTPLGHMPANCGKLFVDKRTSAS